MAANVSKLSKNPWRDGVVHFHPSFADLCTLHQNNYLLCICLHSVVCFLSVQALDDGQRNLPHEIGLMKFMSKATQTQRMRV